MVYLKQENSFDFEPNLSADCSLLIGYLNLTFDSSTKLARQVWGLCPITTWIANNLTAPNASVGGLFVEKHFESGEVQRLVEAGDWKTFVDPKTGWVCIGETQTFPDDSSIEFTEGIIAVINDGQLKSLWLKPTII